MPAFEDSSREDCLTAIDELLAILRSEISAFEKGDLTQIDAILEKKKDLLARIETASPNLQKELISGGSFADTLRERMGSIRTLLDKNMSIAQGLVSASRDLAEEVTRIQKRHSLDGIYGANGSKRGDKPRGLSRYDQSV